MKGWSVTIFVQGGHFGQQFDLDLLDFRQALPLAGQEVVDLFMSNPPCYLRTVPLMPPEISWTRWVRIAGDHGKPDVIDEGGPDESGPDDGTHGIEKYKPQHRHHADADGKGHDRSQSVKKPKTEDQRVLETVDQAIGAFHPVNPVRPLALHAPKHRILFTQSRSLGCGLFLNGCQPSWEP